ncbi:MAG: hypothetical protein R2779_03045 [Crocinitomicaceae bacterium]
MIVGKSPLPVCYTAHAGQHCIWAQIKIFKHHIVDAKCYLPIPTWFSRVKHYMYVKYGIFTAGVWYRTSDAFITTIGNEYRNV